ncbi:MAG: hypothetical protein KGL38_08675 [Gemmatimonadota bacterium]|nr:hypothetical protein [Gemmatimonadota bacterium]MDE3128068.1 hypothetical protein [Gemmatimonadota bacterium]MDE3171906.1 hypothetical protein [Gemmatimonadota bacterium]
MPSTVAALRFPYVRVLLPRTRLAYIHVRNLLTDAKRDRSARVSAYVAVWLPDEFVVFYLLEGEVVNATILDAAGPRAAGIATALERIPAEPEYGDICFHEADEQQLACMYASLSRPDEPWSAGMKVTDPAELFPYLNAMTFDGFMEIVAEDTVNYLVFNNGAVQRAFLSTTHHGTTVDRVAKLFAREGRSQGTQVRRWSGLDALPVQAPAALVQAYRDLAAGLVERLTGAGHASAAALGEQARQNLLAQFPVLGGLSFNGDRPADVIADARALTRATAAWIKDFLFVAGDQNAAPEALLKELTWPRRHVFQSAGLYQLLPWKVL